MASYLASYDTAAFWAIPAHMWQVKIMQSAMLITFLLADPRRTSLFKYILLSNKNRYSVNKIWTELKHCDMISSPAYGFWWGCFLGLQDVFWISCCCSFSRKRWNVQFFAMIYDKTKPFPLACLQNYKDVNPARTFMSEVLEKWKFVLTEIDLNYLHGHTDSCCIICAASWINMSILVLKKLLFGP